MTYLGVFIGKMDEKPYVQTYSIVAGSRACDLACKYCVSQMTPHQGVEMKLPDVNWRNFDLGAKLARDWGASTALITSKGEAALFPEQITSYLESLHKHDFPMIELQTNGLKMRSAKHLGHMLDWYELGMTTVAISIAHYDSEKNEEVCVPKTKDKLDLPRTIDQLHNVGFSVRLSAVMVKGYLDNIEEIERLVDFGLEQGVEQLTVRPVDKPNKSENPEIAEWVENHLVNDKIDGMRDFLDENGTRLRELVHGAIVYDYKGQNICLSNCLTVEADDNAIRQIIFFPDGHVRYDWQHKGAILF